MNARGIALTDLVYEKYRLRDALEKRINEYTQQEPLKAYQTLFDDHEAIVVEPTTPEPSSHILKRPSDMAPAIRTGGLRNSRSTITRESTSLGPRARNSSALVSLNPFLKSNTGSATLSVYRSSPSGCRPLQTASILTLSASFVMAGFSLSSTKGKTAGATRTAEKSDCWADYGQSEAAENVSSSCLKARTLPQSRRSSNRARRPPRSRSPLRAHSEANHY